MTKSELISISGSNKNSFCNIPRQQRFRMHKNISQFMHVKSNSFETIFGMNTFIQSSWSELENMKQTESSFWIAFTRFTLYNRNVINNKVVLLHKLVKPARKKYFLNKNHLIKGNKEWRFVVSLYIRQENLSFVSNAICKTQLIKRWLYCNDVHLS